MPFQCLQGCVKDYYRINPGLRKALREEVIMPWVEMWITENNSDKLVVSVSNFSARTFRASIQSFQFGISNGNGATIEILDEEGGQFYQFFRKISTGNMESGFTKFSLKFQFGWATMSCENGGQTFGASVCCSKDGAFSTRNYQSCKHTATIKAITCDVSQGFFRYTIEAVDMTEDMFSTRDFKHRGTNPRPMPITTALIEMFGQWNIAVKFKQLAGPCNPVDLVWAKNTGNKTPAGADVSKTGPWGTWPPLGRNPIEAARAWLNECLSAAGRGLVLFWDTGDKVTRPTIVVAESRLPHCQDVRVQDQFFLGTYIVNGGQCSPVISFTPEIRFNPWHALAGTSGTTGDALMGQAFREKGPAQCTFGKTPNMKQQGLQATQVPSLNFFANYGRNALDIMSRNKMENLRANTVNPGIHAELRIQGDPSYDTPVLLLGHYIGIVVINPFRIKNENGKTNWVSTGCERELSNTNWMIEKVSHEIKDGQFTTTLRIILAEPGLDIGYSFPVGGMPGAPKL